MLVKILIGLAVVLALLAIVVQLQPAHYRVARSVTIDAPAARVFARVNDIRQWRAWSPFDKLDPAMKRVYEGAASGAGQVYRWSGNSQAGVGSATIVESKPGERILMRLDFEKPMAGTADATFTFTPSGSGTTVEWSLEGEKNFISKAMCMFVSMDKMVGTTFEGGLADLKRVVEQAPN